MRRKRYVAVKKVGIVSRNWGEESAIKVVEMSELFN